MFSVTIASCHRSKYQMPARQITVLTRARRPPKTKASAEIAGEGDVPRRLGEQRLHRVEEAVADRVLETAGDTAEGVGEPVDGVADGRRDLVPDGVLREVREAPVGAREVDRDEGRRPRRRSGGCDGAAGRRRRPRATFSARSLAAVVVRSSMTAITTMSAPGTNAAPTSLIRRPASTGLPRPGPSTNAARVAIESAASVVWLSPTMIVLRAIGSCTLSSRCQ